MDAEPLQTSDSRPALETVAAIATPFGEGGIGIVHVSGPEAVNIVSRLFRARSPLDFRQHSAEVVHYGHIVHGNELVDEVLVRVCRRHESFTGAELVEINCHGGTVSVHRLLDCLQQHGVRRVPAADLLEEAVRNSRIDAIQREAIVELLQARSPETVNMLLAQQRGSLGAELREIGEALVTIARHGKRTRARAASEVLAVQRSRCIERLTALLATFGLGQRLCHPTSVVIAGRASVGKSTLFNELCRMDRAITSDRGGTTRDFVTGQVVLGGFPFELIDTAGIRESLDLIEIESVKGSWKQIAEAHVVLLVLDGSTPVDERDRELVAGLARSYVIPVVNKIDRGVGEAASELAASFGRPPLLVCARTSDGVEEVREALVDSLGVKRPQGQPGPTLFTQRQVSLVGKALDSLGAVRQPAKRITSRRALAARAREASHFLCQCRKG